MAPLTIDELQPWLRAFSVFRVVLGVFWGVLGGCFRRGFGGVWGLFLPLRAPLRQRGERYGSARFGVERRLCQATPGALTFGALRIRCVCIYIYEYYRNFTCWFFQKYCI